MIMNYPALLKQHLFLAFLLFSILAHFAALGAVRIYHWRHNITGPKIMECDYYPLKPAQSKAEALPPPPLEKKISENPPAPPEKAPSLSEKSPPPEKSTEAREEEIDFRAALENLCPSSTPAEEETQPDYVDCLRGKIDSQINYPELALKMGLEGSVVVSFSLNRRGKLLSLMIPRAGRSTYAPFNEEALRSVRRASRDFPAFPDLMMGEVVHFSLPVAFKIKTRNKKLSVH